jgi:uncharacterized protein (DUF362 family)
MKEKKNSGHLKKIDQKNHSDLKVDRRSFLKTTGFTAVSLALPFGFNACIPAEPDIMLQVPDPPTGNITVGIVRNSNIQQMVSRAIELAGGFDEINPGDTVAIKPNLTADTFGKILCTHPEVIRAVIKEVKKHTAADNITVTERSAFGYSTKGVARAMGTLEVVQEEGVNFIAWEDTEYIEAFSDAFSHITYNLKIPKSLTDGTYDHFINVPKLKNHEIFSWSNVDFTACIKAFVGAIHPNSRLKGSLGIHTADLGEKCAELNLILPENMWNVIDAMDIIILGGPGHDILKRQIANAGLIIASKDRVACDSLAVAVLKHYAKIHPTTINRPYVNKSVWDQAQLVRAQELNLGRGPSDITIEDDGVDNIDDILAEWA